MSWWAGPARLGTGVWPRLGIAPPLRVACFSHAVRLSTAALWQRAFDPSRVSGEPAMPPISSAFDKLARVFTLFAAVYLLLRVGVPLLLS